jgi:membrane fusion protein, multidrug efflux system
MTRADRIATAIGAALAALAIAGCGDPAAPGTPAAAAPVRTAPVESAVLDREVRAVGILAPRDEIRLSFKAGGVLDRVAVDVGDRVREGQVLAVLKRVEVDAAVSQAAEVADKARRDLERARQLRRDEVATEEQVEDLTTAYSVARSNLEAARFNARFARIEAPADGIVLQRLAQADELVQGGQPVLVIGSTGDGWIVRAALADRDVVRTNIGDEAAVSFDAFPGRAFAGRVSRIASSADPLTGTFEVEVDVAADGARFARGLVGKVTVTLGNAGVEDRQSVVPVSAIVEANGSAATVYVLDADGPVARRREIVVGPIVGERVVVLGGLAPGEQVITDGAAWLADGRPVRVTGDPG